MIGSKLKIYRSTTENDTIGLSKDSYRLEKAVIFSDNPPLKTVRRLCELLDSENVSYCHWKSNNALERSASGENDLDLLVSREDVSKFTEILGSLGFKRALAPQEKQMPGVVSYFGYDEEADKLIHVHAHYQLIMGHDMTKNFHMQLEKQYLNSAYHGYIFKVPQPEYEFIVYVVRLILKHATWDAILGRQGKLNSAELKEMEYLLAKIDMNHVYEILQEDIPYINRGLFDDCIQVLVSKKSFLARAKVGHRLQSALLPYARHSLATDLFLKIQRRGVLAIRRRLFNSTPKFKLETGGATIAIIGGDGAGKSTAVQGLSNWLSKDFDISVKHMGKPPWSLQTKVIRGILKIGSVLGLYPPASAYVETLDRKTLIPSKYPWLLREICTARDRFLTYKKVRRIAANGGIVLLDRFPHPQIKLMDGPQGRRLFGSQESNRLTRFLISKEESYYQKMIDPEFRIILRVDPEIAVSRKTEEKASYVHERSMEVWKVKWDLPAKYVIKADKPKEEVMAEIKSLVWSGL